jgi:hypothetical protein
LDFISTEAFFFQKKMDELLCKEITEEEWRQVQKLRKKKKPSVPFSKTTLNDCIRPDGLALNIDWISVKAPTLHIPDDFAAPTASAHLCETLARIDKVWVLDNEKACRIVIDALLTEALLHESNQSLFGFCEVKNDWEGTGFGYTGAVDYMFGSSITKSVDTIDSFLLVVEAKNLIARSLKSLPKLAACLRDVLLLGRTPLCLPFLPMDISFASLLLTLTAVCMLPRLVY